MIRVDNLSVREGSADRPRVRNASNDPEPRRWRVNQCPHKDYNATNASATRPTRSYGNADLVRRDQEPTRNRDQRATSEVQVRLSWAASSASSLGHSWENDLIRLSTWEGSERHLNELSPAGAVAATAF